MIDGTTQSRIIAAMEFAQVIPAPIATPLKWYKNNSKFIFICGT